MVDVLFVQGGGAGTHDDWDAALVASLSAALGDGYVVHYPRMPDEDDPRYDRWAAAIRSELDRPAAGEGDGAVVVGHSVGGAILVQALAEQPPRRPVAAVVLLAAPFLGAGGWPADGFEPVPDLGARLPQEVHVVHGLADGTVPPAHADLYAAAVPQAHVHLLPDRDHQLGGDLREVAALVTRRREGC